MRARDIGVGASKCERVRARLQSASASVYTRIFSISLPLARLPVRSRVRTLTRVYERENPGKATPDRRKRASERDGEGERGRVPKERRSKRIQKKKT